jgi:two-component system OmpR family response regulator
MKLLIVEDEEGIILALYRALAPQYMIDTAGTVRSALQKTAGTLYDAIILDLHLPDGDGLKVCEQVRSSGDDTPILVLSGDIVTDQKVTLLDSGANDYMIKPFDIDELKARLRVLLRDPKAPSHHPRLAVGDLVLDRVKHHVQRADRSIDLRRKEFDLLECLMQNSGMAVTRATLSSCAWPDGDGLATNTVDVHIKRLRDKVDRPFVTPLIKTVHGLGYKIDTSIGSRHSNI